MYVKLRVMNLLQMLNVRFSMSYDEFSETFETDGEMSQEHWEELENMQAGLDNRRARLPKFGEEYGEERVSR